MIASVAMETMRRLILESPRLLKVGMTIIVSDANRGQGLMSVAWLYPRCTDEINPDTLNDPGHSLAQGTRCLVLSVHHTLSENWDVKNTDGTIRRMRAHDPRRVFVLVGDEIGWVDYEYIKDVEL